MRETVFGPGRVTRHQMLFACVGIVFGAALLWLSMRDVDLGETGRILIRDAQYRFALPFLLLYGFYFYLKACRWSLLLSPIADLPARRLLAPIVIGYAGNTLMPAQLGEMLRAMLGKRVSGIGVVSLLTSILLERILDLLVIALILGLALLLDPTQAAGFKAAGYVILLVAVIFLVVVSVYVFRTDTILAIARQVMIPLPDHWSESISHKLARGATGVQALRSARVLLAVSLISILMWFVMAGCVHLSIQAFAIRVPFSVTLLTLVLLVVGLALPTIPGAVGTMQFCFVAALTTYGVPGSDSIAASVFYQVGTLVPVLLAGGFYLWRLKMSPRATLAAIGQQRRQSPPYYLPPAISPSPDARNTTQSSSSYSRD